ncbi:MAG: pilus assembly protein [Chloroflexota bacterium]|nr:MAG: pilus assembly protein [Chloroflexota bacterium]
MFRRFLRRSRQQRGQSLVEFTLVVPLLLLSLVGISDLGRVMYYYVAISNASVEGSRQASNPLSTDTDIRNAVHDEASPLIEIAFGDIMITPTPIRTEGQPVSVTVVYRFAAVTPLVNRMWSGGSLNIQSSTTMMVQ